MLPEKLRYAVFERLSIQTMRYVQAIPTREATGLVAETYEQIAEDFFINGSLTSHCAVPELMAGVWIGGREAILQPDGLDQKTKEAMAGSLSRVNDCPYCGDMLVSLVHSAGDAAAARGVFGGREDGLDDALLQRRLQWVSTVAAPGAAFPDEAPFSAVQWPEAIATLVAMGHINRYSHVVMDGSPVPFGRSRLKFGALAMFARELKDIVRRPLEPGRSLSLLPPGELPEDMAWAAAHPRLADALGRWGAAIERHAAPAVPDPVRAVLEQRVQAWQGEAMPLSRGWLDEAVAALEPHARNVARLMLVVALSPWQFSDELARALLVDDTPQARERLVRILNFAAFAGARRLGERLGQHYLGAPAAQGRQVA